MAVHLSVQKTTQSNNKKSKAVLFIHGGSWEASEYMKANLSSEALKSHNVLFITIREVAENLLM
jgi:hypothetical protein